MAALLQPFNPQEHDPSQSVGQLPVGRYPVVIKASEVTAAKSGSSGMLVLELEIADGEHRGSTGAYRLNLYNENQQAAQIAMRQLSALAHAIGHLQPITDSQVLHNRPFIVEVGLQKGEEAAKKGYTEVKRVFDINGQEPQKGRAPSAPQGQQGQQQQPQNQPTQQDQAPQQQQPANNAWGQQPASQEQQPQQGVQNPPPAWGNAPSGEQQAPAWGNSAPQGGGNPPPVWG